MRLRHQPATANPYNANNTAPSQNTYNLMALGYNCRLSVDRRSESGLANAITGEEINEYDAQRIMGHNYYNYSENAKKMKSGFNLVISGIVFTAASPAFVPMLLFGDDKLFVSGLVLGASFFTSGCVLWSVGAVKFSRGRVRCGRMGAEANRTMMSYDENKEPMKLNFGFTGNGVGLALNF